jgi:hypothetical protein
MGSMSYIFTLHNPIMNFNEPAWFNNSYGTINELDYADVDITDAEYEKRFNVKLIYGQPNDGETMRPIRAIEFPSEADALLFILKWS